MIVQGKTEIKDDSYLRISIPPDYQYIEFPRFQNTFWNNLIFLAFPTTALSALPGFSEKQYIWLKPEELLYQEIKPVEQPQELKLRLRNAIQQVW